MDSSCCFSDFIDDYEITDEELNWRSNSDKNLIESLMKENNVEFYYIMDLIRYGFRPEDDFNLFVGFYCVDMFDNIGSKYVCRHLKNMMKLNKEFYNKK